jgi:hypothetical protein
VPRSTTTCRSVSHRCLATRNEKAEAMIPFKSPLLLTVPPTLEKRLEALAALRTLQAQDEELARQRRVAIAALRRDFDELQRDFAALRHRLASDVRSDVLRALKYNPDQPRVPKGSPQGGQWTSEDGSSASPDSMTRPVAEDHPSSAPGPQYAALETGTQTDASHAPNGSGSDYQTGFDAMVANLQRPTYQALTVGEAIAAWAPRAGGNDPVTYANNLHAWTGLPLDMPMNVLTDAQINAVANAIQRQEGWVVGTITHLPPPTEYVPPY